MMMVIISTVFSAQRILCFNEIYNHIKQLVLVVYCVCFVPRYIQIRFSGQTGDVKLSLSTEWGEDPVELF